MDEDDQNLLGEDERQQLDNLQQLFSCINEGVVVIQDGKICFHNDMALDITGFDAETYRSTPIDQFFHPDDGKRMLDRHQRRLAGEVLPPFTDARHVHLDGSYSWISVNSSPINWNGQPATVNLFTDISERKGMELAIAAKNEELERMAITDMLTDLHNRRYMERVLNAEVERSHRYKRNLAVALLDVDHFKKVNDTYGHDLGDQVLITIAEKIKSFTRESDYTARWGGEEFCILFPETDLAPAKQCLERLRTDLATSDIDGVDWDITISGGVTLLRETDSAHDAVKRADELLYQAKDKGRNRLHAR